MKNLYAFHAVVGYFRSSGYFALQPYLEDRIEEIDTSIAPEIVLSETFIQ